MTGAPHRVVVTGIGVVSPLGSGTANYWDGLARGRCAIGALSIPDAELLNQKAAAQVLDFDPAAHFDDRKLSMLDRVSQFAVAAAREAVAASGPSFGGGLAERTATIVGSGAGGQITQDENYRRVYRENKTRVVPLAIPRMMMNAAASQISMDLGLRGPAFVVASACASATHAIGLAFQMVRSGQAQCAVTGGTEAALVFGCMRGWEAMRVMAPDVCRPFSIDRKGMVLGEGAAMFVIETLEAARARGAPIVGEIAGFGMTADAADLTSPDHGGMVRAIEGALSDAGLAPGDVQYINAHGTGTAANDAAETAAIRTAFGVHASALAVSSTKSMVGHALGASGALELAATLLGMREGVAPPTVNYLGLDPACDLDYVPNEARRMPIRAALSNSFAFGGLNAVLAVRSAP